MLLRELLQVPELGLELVLGTEAQQARALRWVCTTDLVDPRRYLSGGELVVTGMHWRRTAGDSEQFVSHVAAAGAAVLAAGSAGAAAVLPSDLIEACRHHDLPLLWVPTEVAFAQITEHVVGAVSMTREAELKTSLARQRRLLGAFAEGAELAEIVRLLGRDTGLVCRVLTPSGRHVVVGDGPLSAADADRVTRTFLTADRLPAVTAGRGQVAYSVFPAGSALVHRPSTWFVVVEGAWAQWDPALVDSVGELAAIAALQRIRSSDSQRLARGIADDALAMLDRDRGGRPETLVRLRQAGVDPGAPLLVAVAAMVGRPDLGEVARSMLEDLAAHVGSPVVGLLADGRAAALLPATEAALPALRAGLARLAPGLGRNRFVVGVAAPITADALSGALREAGHASSLAEQRAGPVSLVAGEEVASHRALLALVPDELRRAFAGRIVGAVLDHDARTGAGLRETLEAFLANSGSWSRTAEQLHLHVNTVRYRIGRVQELSGRDLSSLEDRVDVFLALRSL